MLHGDDGRATKMRAASSCPNVRAEAIVSGSWVRLEARSAALAAIFPGYLGPAVILCKHGAQIG